MADGIPAQARGPALDEQLVKALVPQEAAGEEAAAGHCGEQRCWPAGLHLVTDLNLQGFGLVNS